MLDIKLNLNSTSRFDDEGYFSQFGDGMWKLCKENLIRYMPRGEVNVTDDCSRELWHKKIAYISEKGM